MKYARTWKAIDEAIDQSHGLSEYSTISRTIGYVRQFPTDADCIDWNLVVCAGAEMMDDPKSPIWNNVIKVWNEERKEVALAESQRKSPARLARVS